MFKALVASALLLAANTLRVEMNHDQITWNTIADGQKLDDRQTSWDKWFRDAIPALGDSGLKKMSLGDKFGAAQYLDTTNDNNQQVAWELQASGADDKRKMDKVVQVKTVSDKDDPNVSTITTTTFNRKNIIERSKQLYK